MTTPPVTTPPVVQIIDNGETGHASNGFVIFGAGHKSDLAYTAAGSGSSVSTWTFNVTPGRYKVSSTWVAHANRATDAPYTVYDGSAIAGQKDVNQEIAPNDFAYAGSQWEDIVTVDVTGTTLKVTLSNDANQYVIADAVRIESIGAATTPVVTPPTTPPVTPPPVTAPPVTTTAVVQIVDNGDATHAANGFTAFAAGHKSDLGYAASGSGSSASTWTFTVTPGRYKVATTWVPHVNRATDAPFTVYDGTTIVGQADLNQELAPNDLTDAGSSWENIATVDVTGTTLRVTLTNAANQYVIADAVRIESVSTTLLAAEQSVPKHASVTKVEQDEIDTALESAIVFWASQGASNSALDALRHINVVVTDLPGRTLGLAANGSIYLDHDAAGFGWTTQDDEEGRISLNDVVTHELGHLLGHDHDSQHQIMTPAIEPVEHSHADALEYHNADESKELHIHLLFGSDEFLEDLFDN